jgi:ornithine cyclodeaminase/alanine dehydrogenase-like protein (mu-crystallin family)
VAVFDSSPAAAAAFADIYRAKGLRVAVASDLEDAVAGADMVVTATWAREPFLFRRHVRPGLHITTVGPDQPGKCEVAAEVLLDARVVVDNRSLAVSMGAVGGAGLGRDAIHATLGNVLAGRKGGRADDREVTVFAGVGLPFQDLAAAWLVYTAARRTGAGRPWAAFD